MLKQWVRDRVIEVRGFTETNQWHHIESQNVLADIGTRKGAKIKYVDENSKWIQGDE